MKKIWLLLVPLPFILIIGLTISFADTLSAQGVEGPPRLGGDFEIFAGDYYLPGQNVTEPITPDPQIDYSKMEYTLITFMSWRDGNPEIYTADYGDGSITATNPARRPKESC